MSVLLRLAPAILAVCAAALPAAAQAQRMPTYEPQQRLRTPLDTCLRNEVMRDAWCVQKCAPDFRMEMAGGKPRCVGLKTDAKYTPPKPAYEPPKAKPGAPKPSPGTMG